MREVTGVRHDRVRFAKTPPFNELFRPVAGYVPRRYDLYRFFRFGRDMIGDWPSRFAERLNQPFSMSGIHDDAERIAEPASLRLCRQ